MYVYYDLLNELHILYYNSCRYIYNVTSVIKYGASLIASYVYVTGPAKLDQVGT